MMNSDDIMQTATMVLAMSLLSMVLMLVERLLVHRDPSARPVFTGAILVVMLMGVGIALCLLAYDVFTTGLGYRTFLEAVAVTGFCASSLCAAGNMRESVRADDTGKA